MVEEQQRRDFFISYTGVDRAWAEWIAWALEEAGYTTFVQAWDFRPGTNFVHSMQQAATHAEQTLMVLTPDYLPSASGSTPAVAMTARGGRRSVDEITIFYDTGQRPASRRR